MSRRLKVVFLHPDLGIGGAERLVVDCAMGLKLFGCSVRFLTSHHDKRHCFTETKDGSLEVDVAGDFLPRQLFGHFRALCAYLRALYAAIYLLMFSNWTYDLVFVDQISAPIFLLKIFCQAKIVFYCHHPDMLLTKRDSWIKRLYRQPLDSFEERTTGLAHCVLVNSNFTSSMFRRTFKTLDHINLKVLYPCVSDTLVRQSMSEINVDRLKDISLNLKPSFFLSINRYERKKNIALAIQALAVLQSKLSDQEFELVHLVIAGGFDPINIENRDHYSELVCLTENLHMERHVTFLKSPNDEEKSALLTFCKALIYTPSGEHFGIVPVEAMLYRKPVIAVNDGGPLETVVDGETGFLLEADSERFADAMKILSTENGRLTKRLGDAGRRRALANFSFEVFAEKLNTICLNVFNGVP